MLMEQGYRSYGLENEKFRADRCYPNIKVPNGNKGINWYKQRENWKSPHGIYLFKNFD